MIDEQRRPINECAVCRFKAAEQYAAVESAVAEGEIESLETTAAIDAVGAMKVPAAAL